MQSQIKIDWYHFHFAAPGGIINEEGENVCRTKTCLFGLADSMDKVKAFEQVFIKLMRRYTYASKSHNLLILMKNFSIDLNDSLSTDLNFSTLSSKLNVQIGFLK